MSTPEPAPSPARQQPERTGERRLTGWQRAVRWILWLTFLALAVWNSQNVQFSGVEWVALIAAIGFSIWCMAKPLGGPKVALTKPAHLLGTFRSRTSWGLLLIASLLTIAGVAGAGAAVHDLATGRASIGDVLRDIAIFVEGWFLEIVFKTYDAELEKTHAYALLLCLIPGLIMLWINLIPLFRRGTPFRVAADGSVLFRRRDTWDPLLEYQYATVTADGATVSFDGGTDGAPPVTLPQVRVFCDENGARLKPRVSAEFFGGRLATRGFAVEATTDSSFTARRS